MYAALGLICHWCFLTLPLPHNIYRFYTNVKKMERKRRFVWLSFVLPLKHRVWFLWFAAFSCHSFFCLFISWCKSLLTCFLFSCHYLWDTYIHNLINELLIIVSYFSYLKKKIKTSSDKKSLKMHLNDLKYYYL